MSSFCYLDNSATTRPFDEAIDAMASAMADFFFNPSAAYAPAVAVEDAVNAARARIAEALGGRGSAVFTSGGTEADNLAILGSAPIKQAKFVTSSIEHPAVARTFHEIKARGHEVIVLPVDERGAVSIGALADAVDERTALVSIMHVNNETGAIQDIATLAAVAKKKNPAVLFHSDGVQAFLRVPALPAQQGVDLYTVSAHKVHGPKGVGALFMKSGVKLKPVAFGGGQEGGLRSGTLNAPGILGFGKAVEIFTANLDTYRSKLIQLKLALTRGLLAIEGTAVNGPEPVDGAPHILNVSFDGVQGEALLRALGEQGLYVSTGSACGARQKKPSETLLAMGLPDKRIESAVRLSLSPLNSMDDINRAIETIAQQVKRMRMFKRR